MNGLLLSLALASTPITLEQTRERASINVEALRAELERQRSSDLAQGARANLFPQISLGADVGRSWSGPAVTFNTVPVVDETTGDITGFQQTAVETPGFQRDDFSFGARLNQLIFDGRVWSQVAQTGAQFDAASGQAMEQRLASEYEAIRRFYELFRAQRTLVVLEETVVRSREQVDRAAALFQAGRAAKSELLSAQVNLGNDRINVARQHARIASARADLATWLALPGHEELVAQDPGTLDPKPTPPVALGSALQTARGHRPVLHALSRQVDAARAAVNASRSGFLPRLSGNVSYGRAGPQFDPIFTDLSRNNAVSAGLSLQWDVFNGFGTTAEIGQAVALRTTAELNREQAERDLEAEVARAHRALTSQIDAAEIARANLELAKDGLDLAEERFKAGAGSTLEVRDAQLKLTQAELSLVESRIDVEIARAALERAMGASRPGASR